MEVIMDKIKNTKILGIIGNIIVILAIFMPIAGYTSSIMGVQKTYQYFNGDGKLILILSIINLVIIFADKISPTFFKGLTNIALTMIPTIIQAVILINFTVGAKDLFNATNLVGEEYIKVSFGIGYYMLWVGIILSAICPFMYRGKNNEKIENENKEQQ